MLLAVALVLAGTRWSQLLPSMRCVSAAEISNLGNVLMAEETTVAAAAAAATEATDERSHVDYYNQASHYDLVWGADNMHFGYYPDIDDDNEEGKEHQSSTLSVSPTEAASLLTKRMVEMIPIGRFRSHGMMKVIDLGAGKGRTCLEVVQELKQKEEVGDVSCHGVDTAEANILHANQLAEEHPGMNLTFVQGSFTDLPKEVLDTAPFEVVLSQVSFCHAHALLPQIMEQVRNFRTSYLC